MKAYKGFNKDMKCRNMQYEVGGEYHEDKAKLCEKGFHACEYPLDCLGYYEPGNGSRYAEVELDDVSSETSGDSKRVGKTIKVNAEIGLSGIIKAGVEYIMSKVDFDNAKESNIGNQSAATNIGDCSAATNTGDQSVATNTGYQSVATNTGYQSVATNTGYQSVATNTGYRSAATNTGDQSAATNTGYQSVATNTGYQSVATNTGSRSAATNTGNQSAATNTGNRSAATNTGYQSVATNTGYQSAATNTGYRSVATNTGYRSAATNTGNRSAATVEGKGSIAIATGIDSKAKGALDCYIVLTEYEETDTGYKLKDVKVCKVDGEKIKADTFYKLENGKFVLAE